MAFFSVEGITERLQRRCHIWGKLAGGSPSPSVTFSSQTTTHDPITLEKALLSGLAGLRCSGKGLPLFPSDLPHSWPSDLGCSGGG